MQGTKSLLIGLFICFCIQLQANDYIFKQVTSNTGITFNAINSITDDKYGFIWFGSNNGLYYYNSSEIRKFNFDLSKAEAPTSSIIRQVYKDNNQNLWICTSDGICYFNEETSSFKKLNLTNDYNLGSINTMQLQQLVSDNYLAIVSGRLYSFNLNDLHLNRIDIGGSNTGISCFTSDNNGNVYIAANNGLTYKTDSTLSKISTMYQLTGGAVETLSFFNNQLWIGYSNDGIEVINDNGEKITYFKEEEKGKNGVISNRIRSIIKRANGEVWIGTQRGITVIAKDDKYNITPNAQNGLPHEGIFDLFVGRNDGVWVSTWSGGLAYHHKLNYRFLHIHHTIEDKSLNNSVISAFAEDKNGEIWVGSENHGLFLYDPKNNSFTKKEDSPVQRIKSIRADSRNRIWIGSLFEGLWLYENEKYVEIGNINHIISTVLPTQEGTWIGERGGGTLFYNEKKNSINYYRESAGDSLSISSNGIWDIFKDSKGNIWFCSDNGISVRYKDDKQFTNYYKSTHALSSNINYTVAEDKMGNIWIGTSGAGIDIYDPKTKTFSKFILNEAINYADVYSIVNDLKGNMWFSTNQGIYAYYHDSQRLKIFTEEDGLLGQQYHPNSGLVSKDGILFFGGGNGFNVIDPEIVQPNTKQSEIFLSKLTINNQSINEQQPKFINSNYLPKINEIELNYNQNTIEVAFVANTFIKNSKSQFRYRLLNYMDEWNVTNYNTDISFMKIPPGEYTLQVEYLNNDGLMIAPAKNIQIKINPPFWLSWYAYLLYLLLALAATIIALREVRFRQKSRVEHILFTEKVKFFTNISHEFRTPLTLIISPINSLIKKHANERESIDKLKIIERNADRLLRLTNQILDFRLIEINNLKLKRAKADLVALCKNVYDCFEFQINEKEINCIFNSSFKSFELYIDPEKIEKVVYNILSNAVKYSDEKGQIIVSIEKKTLSQESYSKVFSTGNEFIGDVLEVKIKDNGKGIKKEILTNIFERFYVDAENTETGTGIGLHICQEYMKLHNGNIMVESSPGKETIFTINIPIESKADFDKEKFIIQPYFDNISKQTEEEQLNDSKSKPVILFAEDNNELRIYYKNLLSTKYKVISAKNGLQALEIATELVPDLIISDILMPGMDGLDFTQKIRNNSHLSHIPIILLTALSDNKFKIESMQKGANAFLVKPVDEEILFAKIDSVLRNAKVVRDKYQEVVSVSTEPSGSNKTFIEKIEQIVENNLQNQSFEITGLAEQVGISRSSLQRKIKKTANMSPSEFIREIRLKKAVVLLKSGDYNIDEIAVIVGFNSTSYFIRSFKKKYEMTPTAFKQSIEK